MASSKRKKILGFVGMTIGGIIIGLIISFYLLLTLSVPVTDVNMKLPSVQNEIEITYDSLGIPQIWAENENDAYFALGYQHAADRMFQMDLTRRVASGRLSEMMGRATLDFDIEQRRMGHRRLAEQALSHLSERNRQRLEAYAKGVNTYRAYCRAIPFEYRFVPITFEDWTVIDCLTLLSFQTWFSNALMMHDEFYFDLFNKLDQAKANSLVFDYPDWAPLTVDDEKLGSYQNKNKRYGNLFNDKIPPKGSAVQRALIENLFALAKQPLLMSNSSNAWVISPEKSQSGRAMLASDPHLELSRLPQFWYAVGLHIKDGPEIFGITVPGLPFTIMGHNGKCAYAFTAGGTDLIDYVKLKLNPVDSSYYLTKDGYVRFEYQSDSFQVVGSDSLHFVDHRRSIFGPVIERDITNHTATAVHWAGYDVNLDNTISAAFELSSMENFKQFQKAVTSFGALDANMLYADAEGNIGYQLTSPIMVRESESNIAHNGEMKKLPYQYYPLEMTPHSLNPKKGYIASCNNMPRRLDYLYGEYFNDRIVSIDQLLNSKDKFSSDDMKKFQLDITDRYLLRHTEEIARVLELCGENNKAETIRTWNGFCSTESTELLLILIYQAILKKETFADELPDQYRRIPKSWIDHFEQINQAGWFDNVSTENMIEDYETIAIQAMKKSLEIAANRSWGELNKLTMEHPMAVVPLIGDMLDLKVGPISHSGNSGTLNAAFVSNDSLYNFRTVAGPSMRMVIDFADIDNVAFVLPAGNSGNPMSDHFLDFYPLWSEGRYHTVAFSYDRVKEKAKSVLKLYPEDVD